jgi:mono/diheme cytochrome c family protein
MKRSNLVLAPLSLLLAAVAACYTGGSADSMPVSGSGGAGKVGTQSFDITGLPCDVANVLATSCAGCHGVTPSGGAPNAMTTYEQMVAPSMSAPNLTVAQLALERMKDTKSPMPPSGASAADIAVLEGWITGGAARGTCTTPVAGNGVYNGPTVCTSGTYWTGGDEESSSMHPGAACVSCHSQRGEGPRGIAGTVFPTAHEPDDCNGASGSSGVSVVITDATGRETTLRVNGAGNFYSRRGVAFPYTAKVISATGAVRAMATPQSDGDCNSCHSEGGTNGAPGRIVAP